MDRMPICKGTLKSQWFHCNHWNSTASSQEKWCGSSLWLCSIVPCLVPLQGLGVQIWLPFALLQMLGGVLFQNPSIWIYRVWMFVRASLCFDPRPSPLLIVGFVQSGVSNPLRCQALGFIYSSISCLGADTNDKGATLQQTDPSCSTPRQSRLTGMTPENYSWRLVDLYCFQCS